jgi:hypothetical protein
LDRREEET